MGMFFPDIMWKRHLAETPLGFRGLLFGVGAICLSGFFRCRYDPRAIQFGDILRLPRVPALISWVRLLPLTWPTVNFCTVFRVPALTSWVCLLPLTWPTTNSIWTWCGLPGILSAVPIASIPIYSNASAGERITWVHSGSVLLLAGSHCCGFTFSGQDFVYVQLFADLFDCDRTFHSISRFRPTGTLIAAECGETERKLDDFGSYTKKATLHSIGVLYRESRKC